MRRAVILATLTVLLLAVAGVTAAREDTFTPVSQDPGQPESTIPESTGLEETNEETVETTVETTVLEPEEPGEPTLEEPAQEQTVPAEEDPDDVREDGEGERAGKPVTQTGKPDKPEKQDKGDGRGGKERGVDRQDDAGKAVGKRSGGNPGKVTLCHKDRVTISVGAPAVPAHLRHGDRLGACE